MSATYTTNLRLRKPGTGDTLWGTALNNDLDAIDTMLGGLAVQTLEVPSTSLKITVAPGPFYLGNQPFWHDGTSTGRLLPANSTRVVYLDADEIADAAIGADPRAPFPKGTASDPITPLAVVVTGSSTILSITHWRYIPISFPLQLNGPYANDAAAAASLNVGVGEQYYDSSGIVHVRRT